MKFSIYQADTHEVFSETLLLRIRQPVTCHDIPGTNISRQTRDFDGALSRRRRVGCDRTNLERDTVQAFGAARDRGELGGAGGAIAAQKVMRW